MGIVGVATRERRKLRTVTIGALGFVVASLNAVAEPPSKVARIGVLATQSSEGTAAAALLQGMRELGYVEGKNLAVEWRSTQGQAEGYPQLAAELVRLNVDVIVASSNPAIQAAQRATKTIPIVMVFATDPVGWGFVASLAGPGGKITGLTSEDSELLSKRLQLLKEAVPNVSRVGRVPTLVEKRKGAFFR